ncbi:MAG: Ig-like domain-containing protein [Rudaea sp.]
MPRFLALFLAFLAAVVPMRAVAVVWTLEGDTAVRWQRGAAVSVPLPSGIRWVAPTRDDGAWLAGAQTALHVSRDGTLDARVDVAGRGFGNVTAIAADPYDGSVWVATDAPLLLRFANDGTLVQGTTLDGAVDALAASIEGGAWLVVGATLVQVMRDGRPDERRYLSLDGDERVTALAIDPLRNRVFVGTTRRIEVVLADSHTNGAVLDITSGETRSLALDALSGLLLAVVDDALVAIASDNEPMAPTFEREAIPGDGAIAVLHDASERSFVIQGGDGTARIVRPGEADERLASRSARALSATPFTVEPVLALVRPPDGAALGDAELEVVLRIEALCNGKPCTVPDAYRESAKLDAAVDGASLGEPAMDVATGRVAFPPRRPPAPGVHRLNAHVADPFGHEAWLAGATWTRTVAAPEAQPDNGRDAGAGSASEPVQVKAANKAPSVTLTSPVNGAAFTLGMEIPLEATASDVDGSIAKVEFYRDGTTLLGAASTPPYRYVWTADAPGEFAITAKAYDNRRGTATSSPVAISVSSNQLPVVTLASPVAGSYVMPGSTVALTADARDADGTIASVAFFDGDALVGSTSVAPYAAAWSPASPGAHVLTVRAIDDKGGVGVSAPIEVAVGEAPIVVVTSPVACATLEGPLDLILTAEATTTTGKVALVEFYDGNTLVGGSSTAPWRTTLVNADTGSHAITARAIDDHGVATTSRPAVITVRAPNQPPTVALTAPADGARFSFGTAVDMAANADDPDGTVSAVEFRIGSASGTLVARATRAPFAATWSNPAPGSHTLVAVAFDDRNAQTTSSPVHISVETNVLPTVAVTAPAANTQYAAPATITITASANDTDGTVTKVEFLAGGSVIGSSVAAPYTTTWTGVAAGSYSISARATDNAGAVATSSAVPVTVVSNALPTVALTAPAANARYYAPATLDLEAAAADADGTIARVDFYANGVLIGTSRSAPYTMVWDGVAAGAQVLTARATDDVGASVTSSPVTVNVVGPSIGIEAALDGATIDDDNVLVRGFVSAPANAAVTVNGVVTHIDDYGRFQANDIPLVPGANMVTAVVVTQDGVTSSQSIVVNSSGRGAFVVHAAPTEGLESLDVTFTVENPDGVTFKQIDFDFEEDGLPDLIALPGDFVDGRLVVGATYPAGTWRAVIKAYDDQDQVIYATAKSIVVRLPSLLQGNLRAIYDGMLSRLKAGNVAGALTAFTGSAYEKYSAIFTQLQPSLATIVDQLGEVREIDFDADLAELSVVRDTPDGPRRFMVYLVRAEDGIWRIDGM